MNGLKIFGVIVLFIGLMLGLSLAFGWFDVYYTKTIGKEKENARREVFEQTQSFVEGKRQELTKYRLEYMRSKNEQERAAIKSTIVNSFANFNSEEQLSPELQLFLNQMRN